MIPSVPIQPPAVLPGETGDYRRVADESIPEYPVITMVYGETTGALRRLPEVVLAVTPSASGEAPKANLSRCLAVAETKAPPRSGLRPSVSEDCRLVSGPD